MTKAKGWNAIALLANIDMREAQGCEHALIAPISDPRNSEASVQAFGERFTREDGNQITPSVLLVRDTGKGEWPTAEAISAFRNIIAFTAIWRLRSLNLLNKYAPDTPFSEAFDLYPWMLSTDGTHLTANTLAYRAEGLSLEKFRGQSTPAFPLKQFNSSDFDKRLQAKLLRIWTALYIEGSNCRQDRAIMRSLNMVFQALRQPSGVETTFYDIGRLALLWVSAFEILVWPKIGCANAELVYRCIEAYQYENAILSAPNQMHRIKRKSVRTDCEGADQGRTNGNQPSTFPVALYSKLNDLRNSFAHGNDVAPTDLLHEPSGQSVLDFAPALYRVALLSILPPDDHQTSNTGAEFAHHISIGIENAHNNDLMERVLAMAP